MIYKYKFQIEIIPKPLFTLSYLFYSYTYFIILKSFWKI